ncbi:tetratricopeptide repeat protein [Caballeronia glebae]|uniref:tetratricopeptide repeat protein n=1 Tax=Caballeronia glebae TaxID=1777143 RepID=UPI0038BC9A47
MTDILSRPPADAVRKSGHAVTFDDAERAFLASLSEPPRDAELFVALGRLHVQQATPERAIERLDAALALAPDHADCLNERGIAALMLRDLEGAAHYFREAIRCSPGNPRLHCNLGNAMRDAGRREDAIPHFERALALAPDLLEAALSVAELRNELGQAQDALAGFERAARLAPDDPRALLGRGRTLHALGRSSDAQNLFAQVLKQKPDNVPALFGLARSLGSELRFDEALHLYRRALELDPRNHALLHNTAYVLTCLERYDEADEHLQHAIELKPEHALTNHLLGMSKLRRGDWRAGWALYEHRIAFGTSGGYAPLAIPEWRGEPLDGKRIVLTREQGAGDQLQFVRYAAVLRRLGATVDFWASVELAPLLARAEGVRRAITDMPRDGYDFFCPVMSVPHRLQNEAIPAVVPYLSADARLSGQWRDRIHQAAGTRRKIGLVWAGNPAHKLDRLRSIPLDALLPLADIPGLAWLSLQTGAAASQLDACARRWPINRLETRLDSYDATAAAIESLDLVISVDTSVAHLAGALGKPVWIMLPAQADWRWMTGRTDSPWYPTARLFRQHTRGDWSPVVDSIGAALAAL